MLFPHLWAPKGHLEGGHLQTNTFTISAAKDFHIWS